LLGVELAAPDGSERVSGHSLRATGAQGLAAPGVDTWAIELLGRWGSEAVRGYIRDARLADASAMTRRVAETASLEDMVRRIVSEQSGPGQRAASLAAPSTVGLVGPAPSALAGGQAPATAEVPGVQALGMASTAAIKLGGLDAPLADEVALARLAAAPPVIDGKFVLNSVTGVAHRVVLGFDDTPPTEWLAACGWRYGLSIWRAAPVELGFTELPRAPQLLCARCLPERRRAAADALGHLES